MHPGNGGNHRVFVEGVGLAMHQLSPATEGRAIHGEDVEAVAHLIQLHLDLASFGCVLIAGEFNPGLHFANGHTGEV